MYRFRSLLSSKANVFKLGIVMLTVAAASVSYALLAHPHSAHADTACAPNGIVEDGSDWLDGQGVNVCNNGSSYGDDYGNNYVGSVLSGIEWQCVELVNRLYLTEGWISSHWSGNGDTLVDNLPSGITAQANGGISSVHVGDAISLTGGTYGHVGIINSISGNTVTFVSQNAQLDSSATISSGSLADGNATFTLDGSYWTGYAVQDIMHSSSDTIGNPTLPAEMPRYDLAWYSGSTIYNLEHNDYSTEYATSGWSTPTWAGAGDYIVDGNETEGVFWYLAGNETLYFIPSPPFDSAITVRSGIGAPVWASTGNFTGDGYRDSIAWYDGTNLYLFGGGNMGTLWYTSGYSTPDWAGVGDFNNDGKDDLAWYLENGPDDTGTIYELTSTGDSFNGAVEVRSGIGAPVWAGVGDFEGTHYRDDIAWFDGTTLWSFQGPGLDTTGSVTGYSTPAWAGVGNCSGSVPTEDGLYWYLGNTGTLYCITSNGLSFGGSTALRGPGLGAPVWADSGDFDGD